ncbi:uncharacterized protein LOC113291876 [Papaver somniferum]|uniref:uncharacterized protein LOC113291876 n=1 Tax=Papaver somniferum TaxID=3469 RepID=UPI000E6F8F69|nr:uncharacterized protein LOC113291876 [Papaver somniferum]
MEWNYIIRIFKNFGFSDKWCELIFECISAVKSTVLLNGIPGVPFNPTRGLRQGDSLSPYLFITALEGLSRLFYQDEQNKTFSGTTTGPTAAEALALQQTVRCAKELKISNIKIKADYMDVVKFLNNRASTCDWRAKAILKDVQVLLCNYENVDISYVYRKYNGEADQLARWSRKKQKTYITDDSNILALKNKS